MAKKKATANEPEPPLVATGSYTVLARRYRPQQFAELVGQEPVATALTNALKSGRVAHAYLFTGTRGVGKTSTARILAKALNCEKGPTPTPCDACEACKAIAIGEDVDVIEIDGASNNKVEEVRDLRQNVGFRPSRSRYKIYIIDEVHMLTTAAFNALLKTLEEPPSHVKFIFATTELHKIPITILSRCQRFDFIGIGTERILERLRGVVVSEGMEADDDALAIIARRAAGSMRDAQSLLDQALALGNERLTAKRAQQLLGTADEDYVAALATGVFDHDAARALDLLEQGLSQGVVLGEFVEQLIDYWRDLMLLKTAGQDAKGLTYGTAVRKTMLQQADKVSLDLILACLDLFAATKARLRDSRHPRVLVEMMLVRSCRLENLIPLGELAKQLLSGGVATPGSAPRPEPSRNDSGQTFAALKKNSPVAEVKAEPAPNATPSLLPFTRENLDTLWVAVLEELGNGMLSRRLVADLEKRHDLAIPAPNCLVVRFPSHYTKEKQACDDPAKIARLEEALGRLTGQAVSLRCELIEVEGSAPPEATKVVPRMQQLRRDAIQEPLVKRALEQFGATLIRVDEGFGATTRNGNEPEAAGDHVQGT